RSGRRRRADRSAVRRSQGDDQLRRMGAALLALKLALVPVVFDPGALIAFALPKTIVSESLSAGLLAVLATVAVREGVRQFRNVVIAAIFLVFLAYAIAGGFAVDRYLATFGSHDRLLGALASADMAVIAIALIVVPRVEHVGL